MNYYFVWLFVQSSVPLFVQSVQGAKWVMCGCRHKKWYLVRVEFGSGGLISCWKPSRIYQRQRNNSHQPKFRSKSFFSFGFLRWIGFTGFITILWCKTPPVTLSQVLNKGDRFLVVWNICIGNGRKCFYIKLSLRNELKPQWQMLWASWQKFDVQLPPPLQPILSTPKTTFGMYVWHEHKCINVFC